jgi:hypothetical protein
MHARVSDAGSCTSRDGTQGARVVCNPRNACFLAGVGTAMESASSILVQTLRGGGQKQEYNTSSDLSRRSCSGMASLGVQT